MTRRRPFRPVSEALEARQLLTTLPPGFAEVPVAGGLNQPTAMEFAPDGRLFVTQQTGQLRVIKDGQLLPTPFLSLNVDSSGERGLLGVAFDPQFAANHFVYAYHTVPGSPAHNRISRFTANGETVVRLEERLGYVHKGIEALMVGADIDRAARLAGRTSGDSIRSNAAA